MTFLQCHTDGLVAHIGGVAGDGLLTAVVNLGIVVAGDGNNDRVGNGRDLKPAIDHNNFDVAVVCRGDIKIIFGQIHVILADIGALGFCHMICLQRHIDGLVTHIGGIAGDGLLGGIVNSGSSAAGDGDDDFVGDGSDLQITIIHNDLNVAVVIGSHVKVILGQTHVILADIGALGFGLYAVLQRHADGLGAHVGGIAGDGLLGGIVNLGIMIAGDGNNDLVGNGGDLQPAVSVLHFHLLVVGGGGGEVRCRQTHVILADIGTAGNGCLVCRKRNGCVGRIAGDYIAGDGLLCAVIDLGISVALDNDDRLLGLGDGQRAVVIGDGVVSGDRAAVYFNGSLVDDVGLAAHICDGALFRHGEGHRISIDQTHCCEVRLGQGGAVINLAGVICGKRQRNGVVNGDLVPADSNVNGLAGGVAVHHGGSILRIQSIRLAGGQLGADGLRTGLVGGHGDGGAQQVMVNGVLRHIQLEVQLQHSGAVAAEGGGFYVGSTGVIGILAVFLVRLVGNGDGNGGIGGAGAAVGLVGSAGVGAVVVHVVELDRILRIRVGCPNSVQIVGAIGIHADRSTGAEHHAAAGGSAPALEGVADSGEQSRFAVALYGDQAVVCKSALGGGLVSAEVAVIGQGDGAFLHAPNGIKRHIRSTHGQHVPGDILRCGCIGVRAPA